MLEVAAYTLQVFQVSASDGHYNIDVSVDTIRRYRTEWLND